MCILSFNGLLRVHVPGSNAWNVGFSSIRGLPLQTQTHGQQLHKGRRDVLPLFWLRSIEGHVYASTFPSTVWAGTCRPCFTSSGRHFLSMNMAESLIGPILCSLWSCPWLRSSLTMSKSRPIWRENRNIKPLWFSLFEIHFLHCWASKLIVMVHSDIVSLWAF